MDIDQTLGVISSGMLVRQALTIVFLTVLGYFFMWAVGSVCKKEERALLSFPVGLSFFCTAIYSMLVVKIRITIPRLIFVSVFAFAAVAIAAAFYRKKTGGDIRPAFGPSDLKLLFILILIALPVAFFSCSQLLSIGLDNDSYYYFSTYPQILIEEGDLKYEFDVLLTDTGLMAVIINAIPYVFGFMNTFGIQHFLNINFLLLFAYALFTELNEKNGEDPSKQRNCIIISALVTLFLATSPAYITTAKWVMAGDYFMVFFFLLMYFGYREVRDDEDMPFVLMLFTVMTAMLRQEGPIMAAFLIFCLSVLKYTNLRLITVYMLPLCIAAGYYYLRVFVFLGVKPLYAFLTPVKAILIMGFLTALLPYFALIRGKILVELQEKLLYLIPLFLVVANVLMLIKNHSRYLANIYAFFMNIRLRNGWGYFGYFFFVFIVIAVILAVKNKDYRISFFDMIMIGYILAAVCAAWGRGDDLRIGTGDSGNRVMLTAVPIITYAMTLRLFKTT